MDAVVSCGGEKTLLRRFLHSCLSLEELEIISFGYNCSIISADLSFVSQCRALRKLTLAGFHIQNGHFLEQVLTYYQLRIWTNASTEYRILKLDI